jgi:tellurite resistance protein TehA-like permease
MHRAVAWTKGQVAALNPGAFALVMATGIISNAFFLEGHRAWADSLFAVILFAYPCLVLFTLLRLALFSRALWRDLIDPRLVFSFFTIVAGTGVFGAALDLRGFASVAMVMWLLALAVWFVLVYFSFAVLIFLNSPRDANIVHGGWLNAIVGTESLAILGVIVAPEMGGLRPAVFVLAHMLWGVGLALYGIFVTLFAYRIFFSDVDPEDITPVLWVVMGAAAITTNAGSTLILADSGMSFLQSMRPLIDGVTLVMWAWATWWIPLLLMFGIWKHGIRRVPLRYTPMLWSLVFPLGMYAVATLRLSLAADFSPLKTISHGMIWVALAAWIATAIGFLHACWQHYRQFTRAA